MRGQAAAAANAAAAAPPVRRSGRGKKRPLDEDVLIPQAMDMEEEDEESGGSGDASRVVVEVAAAMEVAADAAVAAEAAAPGDGDGTDVGEQEDDDADEVESGLTVTDSVKASSSTLYVEYYVSPPKVPKAASTTPVAAPQESILQSAMRMVWKFTRS
jgi:hypothetical protein